jgi:hypothetical protein
MPKDNIAITFPQDSTVLSSAVRETEDRTLKKRSGLQSDHQEERLRIDARLKEKGFYYFYLIILKFR